MRTHKLTYSHRHSSRTDRRRVWYVDRLTEVQQDKHGFFFRTYKFPAPTPEETLGAAKEFARKIRRGARAEKFFDGAIVILEET